MKHKVKNHKQRETDFSNPSDYFYPTGDAFIPCFFLGIMLIGFSVLMLATNWRDVKGLFVDINSWKASPGIITQSYLRPGRNSKSVSTLVAEVRYTYDVGGQRYNGDRICFNDTSSNQFTKGVAESYVHKYPVGKLVNVYYMPQEPDFSVLEPYNKGFNGFFTHCIFGIIGFALIITGAIFDYYGADPKRS